MSALAAHATPSRPPSIYDVQILSLEELRAEAVQYFISLDPARRSWPQEKIDRIVIRSECRWGRMTTPDADGNPLVFMLNEKGQGPREPLSAKNCAFVNLYAEIKASKTEAAVFQQTPFAKVPINDVQALGFKTQGLVKLEEFILRVGADCEIAYNEWVSVMSEQTNKIAAIKAKRAAKKGQGQAPGQSNSAGQPKQLPHEGDSESEGEGEQGPRARV